MSNSSIASKVGSVILWILGAVVVVALAGSILLPSTKRGHIDFEKLRKEQEAAAAASGAGMAQPNSTTQPTTLPTTLP